MPGDAVKQNSSRAFVFGKLPAHGDFVARGLSPDERDDWDGFLSASIAEAREALGARYEAQYDSAPAWRFALADRSGAIAPSIDRAGRRFPLMLGLAGNASVAGACEELIYRALGDAMTIDAVWDAVGEIEGDPANDLPLRGWWIDGGEEAGIAPLPQARPTNLIRAMLAVTETAQ
jgi:type VI secretion system protein ImpM